MLAHGFALLRDAHRFRAAYGSADVSALGAGALAGNTLGLDPDIAARELEFSSTFDNAMDAVSDRDFVADLLFASALCSVHLSRMAEELVLWTSSEFGFARIGDDWSTGSSMMPQKRNPDLAELIRGRAAANIADLTGLLTLIKGLPLAYNRDLQEDKLFLFRALERILGSIGGMTRLLGAIRLDKEKLASAAAGSATWATDLAERLVDRGAPFREAHEVVGELVGELEATGRGLQEATGDLEARHPLLKESDAELADPLVCLRGRSSAGGTAPERVAEQAAALRKAAESLGDLRR
jgi:argininosuccinate lyase